MRGKRYIEGRTAQQMKSGLDDLENPQPMQIAKMLRLGNPLSGHCSIEYESGLMTFF